MLSNINRMQHKVDDSIKNELLTSIRSIVNDCMRNIDAKIDISYEGIQKYTASHYFYNEPKQWVAKIYYNKSNSKDCDVIMMYDSELQLYLNIIKQYVE